MIEPPIISLADEVSDVHLTLIWTVIASGVGMLALLTTIFISVLVAIGSSRASKRTEALLGASRELLRGSRKQEVRAALRSSETIEALDDVRDEALATWGDEPLTVQEFYELYYCNPLAKLPDAKAQEGLSAERVHRIAATLPEHAARRAQNSFQKNFIERELRNFAQGQRKPNESLAGSAPDSAARFLVQWTYGPGRPLEYEKSETPGSTTTVYQIKGTEIEELIRATAPGTDTAVSIFQYLCEAPPEPHGWDYLICLSTAVRAINAGKEPLRSYDAPLVLLGAKRAINDGLIAQVFASMDDLRGEDVLVLTQPLAVMLLGLRQLSEVDENALGWVIGNLAKLSAARPPTDGSPTFRLEEVTEEFRTAFATRGTLENRIPFLNLFAEAVGFEARPRET